MGEFNVEEDGFAFPNIAQISTNRDDLIKFRILNLDRSMLELTVFLPGFTKPINLERKNIK